MRFIVLLILMFIQLCCMGQYIQSATLAAGGSMGGNNGKYYLSHVVSQSSIVAGTARNGSVVIRQGFKQPFSRRTNQTSESVLLYSAEPKPQFEVEIFPNPFFDQFNLRFSRESRTPTRLTLYDASSNLIWEGLFPAEITEIPLRGFTEMRAGKYLLQIFQHGQPITKTIIKEGQP